MKDTYRDELKLLVAMVVALFPVFIISAVVHVKEHNKRKRIDAFAKTIAPKLKAGKTADDLAQEFEELIHGTSNLRKLP